MLLLDISSPSDFGHPSDFGLSHKGTLLFASHNLGPQMLDKYESKSYELWDTACW